MRKGNSKLVFILFILAVICLGLFFWNYKKSREVEHDTLKVVPHRENVDPENIPPQTPFEKVEPKLDFEGRERLLGKVAFIKEFRVFGFEFQGFKGALARSFSNEKEKGTAYILEYSDDLLGLESYLNHLKESFKDVNLKGSMLYKSGGLFSHCGKFLLAQKFEGEPSGFHESLQKLLSDSRGCELSELPFRIKAYQPLEKSDLFGLSGYRLVHPSDRTLLLVNRNEFLEKSRFQERLFRLGDLSVKRFFSPVDSQIFYGQVYGSYLLLVTGLDFNLKLADRYFLRSVLSS